MPYKRTSPIHMKIVIYVKRYEQDVISTTVRTRNGEKKY